MATEKSSAATIGAIAAMITAIVGACALIYQIWPRSSDEPQSQPQQPGVTNSAVATSKQTPARPAGPLWEGDLLFDNSGLDFDVTPPKRSADGAIDIYDSNKISILTISKKYLIQWTEAADPTPEQCAARIRTHGVNSLPFDVGSRFCFQTLGLGRIVFVTFLKPGPDRTFEIHATVWTGSS